MRSILLFGLILLSITGNAFCQTYDLALTSDDIRIEESSNNSVEGFLIYIRKKPDIESVILTEPTGAHALRATVRNSINGNEQRQISGVTLKDEHSQYSIVSSTPQTDTEFGRAFVLFVPLNVIYGNPTSPLGTVNLNINLESQINIRTFPHRFADPSGGRYKNNHVRVGGVFTQIPYKNEIYALMESPSNFNVMEEIKKNLKVILIYTKFFEIASDDELRFFLNNAFKEKDNEQRNK